MGLAPIIPKNPCAKTSKEFAARLLRAGWGFTSEDEKKPEPISDDYEMEIFKKKLRGEIVPDMYSPEDLKPRKQEPRDLSKCCEQELATIQQHFQLMQQGLEQQRQVRKSLLQRVKDML